MPEPITPVAEVKATDTTETTSTTQTAEQIAAKEVEAKKTPETIPYSVFAEKNNELKVLKEKLAKEESDKLIASWKIEEAYKLQLAEKDNQLFEIQKQIAISKFDIPENLKKYVTGKTMEEIETSAKELAAEFTETSKQKRADAIKNELDPAGKKGEDMKGKVFTLAEISKMSNEDYRKNLEEINKQLKNGLVK